MDQLKIAILGAGNMGTAVAQVLALRGQRVRLWDYNHETIKAITQTGANEKFLPGVKLSRRIVPEASMERAVENADLVIVACASPYVRETTRHLAHCLLHRHFDRVPRPRDEVEKPHARQGMRSLAE